MRRQSPFFAEKSAKKIHCQFKAEKNAYSFCMTMVKGEKNIQFQSCDFVVYAQLHIKLIGKITVNHFACK